MEKLLSLYRKYREVIMYLVFGVLTTVISVVLFALLSAMFKHLSPALGYGDALTIQNSKIINMSCVVFKNIIAILFAYVTNRKFVFESKVKGAVPILIEMANFFLARLSTMIFEVIFMIIMVNKFGFNDLIMNIIVQFVIVVLNYVLSKLWIFKKK